MDMTERIRRMEQLVLPTMKRTIVLSLTERYGSEAQAQDAVREALMLGQEELRRKIDEIERRPPRLDYTYNI